jgi:Zn finger protein HypA/HybF involved in hydrogenase expression
MKTTIEARKAEFGVEPKHEIEVLCSHCKDPVSALEEASGTCTNCNQPWQEIKSVSIWVTTLPAAGAKTWGQ